MKQFRFSLDRILDWRRTQVRIEQSRLERMLAEFNQYQSKGQEVEQQKKLSEQSITQAPEVWGIELAALESFRSASDAQSAELARSRTSVEGEIRKQRDVIAEKERDVLLLEKFREARWKSWRMAQEKEIDQQAEEAHLARWKR